MKFLLEFTDALIFAATGNHLSQPQRSLLLASWSEVRQNYDQIAEACGYSPHYLRKHIGPQLWKLLSEVLKEKVTKVNSRYTLEHHWKKQQQEQSRDSLEDTAQNAFSPVANWGEAIDVEFFYGRQQELLQLEQWTLEGHCRVIGLFGVGGIGKTYLALKLAQQLAGQNTPPSPFQVVIWRSLRNAPPLPELLADLLQVLNPQQPTLPAHTEARLSLLLSYLRSTRCLIILDNLESILQSGSYAGNYRDGYDHYGQFLQRLGETAHQGCLILTSREKPKEFALLEGDRLPVRSVALRGLQVQDGQQLFQAKGIRSRSVTEEAELVHCYSGNPLALKIVSAAIQELFDGEIRLFLQQEATVIGGIEDLLAQQFERLSHLEQTVLYWLAIAREPISLETLRYDMIAAVPQRQILEAIQSLGRRSLLEKSNALFSLQPVVMEYVGDRLISQVAADLSAVIPSQETLPDLKGSLFKTHSLIKAEAKDYVREAQTCLILAPLVKQLLTSFNAPQNLEQHLKQILAWQRSHVPSEPGYLAGNVLNLLRYLEADLSGLDCSNLTVWQAYLDGANLCHVNFTNADLSRSVLSETFASTLSLAFSPDGKLLATATTDNEICLWQVAEGRKILICQGHTGWVHTVAFSPCGNLFASGSEDETIRLWDVQSGQCIAILKGHTHWVWSLAFNPDGTRLASGSNDQTIRLWDIKTEQCLQVLQGHTGWVWSVAFAPNGSILASGSTDHSVRIWDVQTGICLRVLEGHDNWVQTVAFNPMTGDDPVLILASGSNDRTVRLWNAQTGDCFKILEGHTNWVQSLAFCPRPSAPGEAPLLASSSNDQTVKLWNLRSGQCLRTLKSDSKDIWSIAFSPDGTTLASGGSDQIVKLWDARTGYCLRTLKGYNCGILSASFSPDGRLLATGGSDRTIHLWNLTDDQPLYELKGHTSWVRSVAFSPDGKLLASGGSDHTIRLWNLSTQQCLRMFHGHASWVRSVAFSPDGKMLVSGSTDHTIRLWEVQTGQCLNILEGHTHWVRCVAVHPSLPLIASSGDDQTIRLWDSVTGECLKVLRGHTTGIWSVAFSDNGCHLASGGDDRVVMIWDLTTGTCLRTLKGHTNWIQSVAFSPDHRTLASASNDQTIRLWDIETGQCLNTLQGHTHRIWVIRFSPAALEQSPQTTPLLISGGEDETLRCWDVSIGKCTKTLRINRPYEAMNIYGIKGITTAQKNTLLLLGAIADG
jgi:WD40 repeat protein